MTKPSYRPLVAVGDLTWDVLAKPDHPLLPGGDTTGRVQLAGGGSSANLAVWAARVGYPSAFVGKVGRDRFGTFAVEELEAERVEPHVIWSEAKPTGVIVVFIDANGERSNLTSQGADFDLRPEELPVEVLQAAAHVHITAWSVFTNPPCQAALQAARLAAEAGATVSFDPGSYQMILQLGPRRFRQILREFPINFLFPNLEEGRALTGATEPDEVLETLVELYPEATVALKLGPKGALIAEKGRVIHLEATADVAVDATGAGDAFGGAFLGHYLRSRDAQAAGRLAVQVAGWVVTRFGARGRADDELKQRLRVYGVNPP
ncbi:MULTISPECIES: carbohydrate kinase family protein [unclassified Meiothermus]|uniref:carbohydrate kinase family protein n=1 Tax=unclassified Meiothermus TaxID=370471 RepID=UPI000D7CC53B|nr:MULTISPECIES: sugar kinase [unclassified Meiothermus]PZA07000.1 carbohydrate kinase family protein [Meiothermus sp. Pnk-1]RYM35298.1 sugar kinase [Meiothermus sp. PNK-Is4]